MFGMANNERCIIENEGVRKLEDIAQRLENGKEKGNEQG